MLQRKSRLDYPLKLTEEAEKNLKDLMRRKRTGSNSLEEKEMKLAIKGFITSLGHSARAILEDHISSMKSISDYLHELSKSSD